MAQTKAVAKAATLDLATLASDSKDASGFDNLDVSRDIAIPYINILQSGSPQINPSKAEHVEGAKVGQFYNTVSQLVSDTIDVIPVLYQLRYVEWKPREQGGGFVEAHSADSGILSQTKRDGMTRKDVLPSGNYIATTAYHYVMILGKDGSYSQAVEKVGQVEDADVYEESKAFSTAASRGDVEAKPVAEAEVAKEAPTLPNDKDDIPF